MDVRQWLGSENTLGVDIWERKYKNGNETFDEWLERVSGGNEKLKQLIFDKKFLFGGRILANRGIDDTGTKSTINNCYCLPAPEDNIESIYQTCSDMAKLFSQGGGVGFHLSKLRPRGSKVNNTAKTTTGAVSFMETFSQVSEVIGQSGRRGALMLSLDCNHPDIEEFIDIKTDLEKVTKANISIRVDDEFMKAVINNNKYKLTFDVEATGEHIEKEIDAYKLFKKFAQNNHGYAEPGILFWDAVQENNLMNRHKGYMLENVNPCGELPLPKYGACCLGSFNLDAYVKNKAFDYDEFEHDIYIVVEAMNDLIDYSLEHQPLEQCVETIRDLRQIGVGIMGLADALIHMGLRYDSPQALRECQNIAFTLSNSALSASALLAKRDGAFPKCEKKKIIESYFMMQNADEDTLDLIEEYGLRNSTLLAIAPTGSLSTMLGISGGIEPIFNTSYTRRTESLHGETKYYKVYTPIVKEMMEKYGLEENDELFATAQNIDPFKRIEMQGIWQEHIDASISSTINLPEEATVELIEELYIEAWKNGLKGLTIFRDNCHRVGILTNKEQKEEEQVELARGQWKSLAEDTYYIKRNLTIGCGKLKLFIGYSPSEKTIQDLYIVKVNQGGCEKNLQALAITMSALLRVGGNLDQLEKAFGGIAPCPSFVSARAKGIQLSKGNYCGIAIINEVKAFLKGIEGQKDEPFEQSNQNKEYNTCPECGEKTLVNTGGCNTCTGCGWSKCL